MKKYLIFVFALAALAGCASPYSISRLKVADEEKVVWRYGAEVVTLQYKGLFLEASFIESLREHLVFNVKVTNTTKKPVLVDPARFGFIVESFWQNDNEYSQDFQRFAVDPEEHLLEIDAGISRSIADKKNALTAAVISEVVVTAAEAAAKANDDDDDENDDIAREIRRAERLNNIEKDQIKREIHISNLHEERNYWANKTLRKTTLFPNEEIGGLVFFNRNEDFAKMVFNFKLEDIDYKITYIQRIHKP